MYMKRIQVFIISLISVLLLASCNKTEPDVDSQEDLYYVSLDMAKDFVRKSESLGEEMPIYYGQGIVYNKANPIAHSHTVKDEQGKDIYHILTFRSIGYIIISADNRLSPILAYSNWGSFDTQATDYPAGLVNWLSLQKERVQRIRAKHKEQEAQIAAQWKPFQYAAGSDNFLYTDPYAIQAPLNCANIKREFGPILWGKWVQHCEAITDQKDSCYWYFDLQFNAIRGDFEEELYLRWQSHEDAKKNEAQRVYIKDFLEYRQLDGPDSHAKQINYLGDPKDSRVKYINLLHKYNLVEIQPRDINAWGQFKSQKPKQSWFCDGYRTYQLWHGDCESGFATYNSYLHMNWGWRGAFDGWYSIADLNMP